MPTKHIDEELWKKIEAKTVDVVIHTKKMVKDTDILQAIIQKGMEQTSMDDLINYISSKKRK
ncbi:MULTISPECIES: hypothetical protein [Gallibacterium]|uniref:Repressor n=3 Tax=Gallibacterium anatis TaxID=750 RepID=U1GJS0_9PAST|nr:MULTISPECIES: hypothetical protein [Gallibacterium]ERF77912.1 hypothetical protein N561_09045 [Gallibacterium anatis 12656/12]KGQ64088.1 hypothetical protein IO48_00325 [Gallibacterium anatis 4895]MDA3977593.1 hypothetical protein [Gallibacterium sp. AGMB14963]HJF74152.1 hypothetical protein [Gallibacterium anatis]